MELPVFIGDVHGMYDRYRDLIARYDRTFQLGDLGLGGYASLRQGDDPLPEGHVAIAGNHDVYDRTSSEYFKKQPFFLGDYGVKDGVFYVRGGFSIDHAYRVPGREWWPEEELSQQELSDAIETYSIVKPDVVATHECPLSFVEHVTSPGVVSRYGYADGVIPTRTNQALQAMLEIHRPALWVFGHYHRRRRLTIRGTRFVAVDMIRGRSNDRRDSVFKP